MGYGAHRLVGKPLASPLTSGPWPRLMRAETAASYVDEKSVESFRNGVGKLYPQPHNISGKGQRWLKEEIDLAIERIITGRTENPSDIADLV